MAADRNPIVQVVRRWRVQAYLDFMWMTRDFKFFLINVVSDLVLSLSGVMAVFFLAERFAGIGAWSRDQILFMLGYAALVQGLLEMFFRYNVLAISRRIGPRSARPHPGAAAAFVDGPAHGRLYTLLWLLGIYSRVGDQRLVFGAAGYGRGTRLVAVLWSPPAVFLCGGLGLFLFVERDGVLVAGGCRRNKLPRDRFCLAVEVVSPRWAASALGQRPVERAAGGFCRLVSLSGICSGLTKVLDRCGLRRYSPAP